MPAGAAPGPVDVVSVVYETELPLQRLQLRSLAAFADPDVVGRVIVIDNCARPMPAAVRRDLEADAGPFAARLEVLRPRDIARVPRSSGWRSQQVLKLAVARRLADGPYVVLDAKNHLIAPLRREHLVDADGRGVVPAYGYATHPLRSSLERVLRYLEVDPAAWIDGFPSTVTPFVLDAGVVREVLDSVERRAGRPFAQEFVARELTEFFLYSGWIIADGRGLDSLMTLGRQDAVAVWPKDAPVESLAARIDTAAAGPSPFFSVHRRALARLDDAGVAALAAFWGSRGLFPSPREAALFIRDFAVRYEREEARQRRRELPAKAAVAIRRMLGRGRR